MSDLVNILMSQLSGAALNALSGKLGAASRHATHSEPSRATRPSECSVNCSIVTATEAWQTI